MDRAGFQPSLRDLCPSKLAPPMLKRWASDSHAQQIVQEMMAYVQQHYHRPMSLGDVAVALKMNAAYLSSLFSATAGVTFHKHLEGVRLTKAQELLRDPHNRVCEVACVPGRVPISDICRVGMGVGGDISSGIGSCALID